MAPWEEGNRKQSWASNGNIAVYIFCVLFAAWLGFQIWARLPGGAPAPIGLDAMVMAALGVAITTKSVEKNVEKKQAEVQGNKERAELREQIEILRRARDDEDKKDSGESM